MTESGVKAPKPFLKKGTRKYLSNATVRSGNQSNKVVDFAAEDTAPVQQEQPVRNAPVKDFTVEIKVNNRPKPKLEERTSGEKVRAKQNKQINQDRNVAKGHSMGQDRLSSVKKKTMLDDYLPVAVKNTGKSGVQVAAPLPPQSRTTIGGGSRTGTMAAMLNGQQQQQEPENSSSEEDQGVKTTTPSFQNKDHWRPPQPAAPPTTILPRSYEEQDGEVNFQSDESEEGNRVSKIFSKNIKTQAKVSAKKKSVLPGKGSGKWSDEEQQEEIEQAEEDKPNKILQKYYKKGVETQIKPQQVVQPQQLSSKDIPMHLKQTIFNEMLQQTSSDINHKLIQLKQSLADGAKEKQKWQQENKKLSKQRESFEKEMQVRKKEFEDVKKIENNKLSREKMYLKEKQTSGKADYQLKIQLQEARKRMEELESEKKKIKTEKQREIDRLKRKVQELSEENSTLKQQMKFIERERVQAKEKAKAAEKKGQIVSSCPPQAQPTINKTAFWNDCPTSSYIRCMLEDDFSLMDLTPEQYNFDQIEYYKYYLSIQQVKQDALLSEQQEPNTNKITRYYRSGKKEVELVQLTLKETFPPPFKFSIVHHANGDVKLLPPEGIQIYFSSRAQTSQFVVTPTKMIYSLHSQGQVQLKFTHPRKGKMEEVYFTEKKMLRRMFEGSGRVQIWVNRGGVWSQMQ